VSGRTRLSRPKGPLTVQERQRILELASLLQQSPLDPALRPEYQELFIVVVQARISPWNMHGLITLDGR